MYSCQEPHHTQDSHYLSLQALRNLGLPVNPANQLLHSIEMVEAYYQDTLDSREDLDYEIDGVVIKADSLTIQEAMGATGHEPRWATAWKFPSERVTTVLRHVTISPGRFGRLTPVAMLEPVQIAGVTVQSASLHNETDMRRKDIRVGDEVIIERAGDVIPQVAGPVNTDPNRARPVFQMPDLCPFCDTPVSTVDGEIGHWCANDSCPSRLPERLNHFVSKRAMDIEFLGEHWCNALIEAGLVQDPSDLYFISKDELLNLDRMGPKNAERLLSSIETSQAQPLDRVLYSLGIYRLGGEVSGLLAERCSSVEEAVALTHDQLAAMDGIGPKIASSVHNGLHSPRVAEMIRKLRIGGVAMERPQHPEPTSTQMEDKAMQHHPEFSGKTFVVTGKIEGLTRNEAESMIRERGGSTASSVSKTTNILVVAGSPTDKPSTKLKKAREMGVSIMHEPEFMSLLSA